MGNLPTPVVEFGLIFHFANLAKMINLTCNADVGAVSSAVRSADSAHRSLVLGVSYIILIL
jgi:hypothetical protein